MQLDTLIDERRDDVLAKAAARLTHRDTPHYRDVGTGAIQDRLDDLYGIVADAVASRSLTEVDEYAAWLAQHRYDTGVTLDEVQLAFNALERELWTALVESEEPVEDLVEALGLLSTVFGTIKDGVARRYVELATHRHAPAVDLSEVSSGTYA